MRFRNRFPRNFLNQSMNLLLPWQKAEKRKNHPKLEAASLLLPLGERVVGGEERRVAHMGYIWAEVFKL